MLLVSVVKQGDGQPFKSKPPAPPKSVKEPNPIPARVPKSFTMGRNRCSRWPGMGVHVAPESAFTLARKTHSGRGEKHKRPGGNQPTTGQT